MRGKRRQRTKPKRGPFYCHHTHESNSSNNNNNNPTSQIPYRRLISSSAVPVARTPTQKDLINKSLESLLRGKVSESRKFCSDIEYESTYTNNRQTATRTKMVSSEDTRIATAKTSFVQAVSEGIDALMSQCGYSRERATNTLVRELSRGDPPSARPDQDEVSLSSE